MAPSLINRGYILDLRQGYSFARWLAARGHEVFLVDWGDVGPLERRFTMGDYVAGRLSRAVDAVTEAVGPPVLLGYCMGGNLAVALACLRPSALRGLVTIAAPWDFHAEDSAKARNLAAFYRMLLPAVEATGDMPVDMLQSLFAGLDPLLAVRKFLKFASLDPDGPEAISFVALEDWLNDGVPLPAAVARECLMGWYGENTPATGRWVIAGRPVEPAGLSLPSLVVLPATDRIVPPKCARALADEIPGATLIDPPLGHIGMMTSRRAQALAWEPIGDWVAALPQ